MSGKRAKEREVLQQREGRVGRDEEIRAENVSEHIRKKERAGGTDGIMRLSAAPVSVVSTEKGDLGTWHMKVIQENMAGFEERVGRCIVVDGDGYA